MAKHHSRFALSIRGLVLSGAFLYSGCDKSRTNDDSPAGSYTATSLITTTNGQATDHVANGSSVAIVLAPDGTTSGEVHIKPIAGTPALDADLTGTWTSKGRDVDLDHWADTFLRDLPLTFNAGTLVGDRIFDRSRLQLTLSRR
ncbi:MAG: hypothetical protein M3365_04305 [Gemmatimonadota bacterium]|nr:hypothetical protein [Gemmatimonadota bacterium]